MASPVACVAEHERRTRALGLLASTSHNGFPVVDARGRLVGMCLRSQLSVLIHGRNHASPGSNSPYVRRALDTYMRVAHLRRGPMPRPLLPRPRRPRDPRRRDPRGGGPRPTFDNQGGYLCATEWGTSVTGVCRVQEGGGDYQRFYAAWASTSPASDGPKDSKARRLWGTP